MGVKQKIALQKALEQKQQQYEKYDNTRRQQEMETAQNVDLPFERENIQEISEDNIKIGQRIPDIEKVDIFQAPEGEANMYYGQIGSGKTYGATADIHELLAMGRQVYATWPIKVDDFDDRESFFMLFKGLFFFQKKFYRIPRAKNFHFIDAEKGEVDGKYTFNPARPSEYIDWLNTLNHCDLFIDEAWRVIDSYQGTKFSLGGRDLILVTRHKFRTVNLIAQRPTSVHVVARGNINRFYKFKKLASWPWVRFARYEFQEMSGETVNEEAEPISIKTYWGSSKIFNSYNSYFYGDLSRLHDFHFDVYNLTSFDKIKAINLKIKKSYTQVIHRLSTVLKLAKSRK
jgi:hypothetical protein